MAAPSTSRPRLVALDTNVLLHLAEEHAPAHNLVLRLVRLGFTPIVTQTVVQELAFFSTDGNTVGKRAAATKSLTNMLSWGIQPHSLKPVGNGICDVAADVIASRGIIPAEERNDAFVAIESAFFGVTMLITWDSHLLDAPPSELNQVLESFDLHPIQVVHPRVILEK